MDPHAPSTPPPPFWSSGWSLHPSWQSQYRPWQMWKKSGVQFVPCHEQHRPGMVNFGAHGMPWNAMECGTPRALIQQGPLGESSFCATFLSFLSGFQIFQIFHLHVTWTSQPIQMSRMAHDDVWHHIWLKGILW